MGNLNLKCSNATLKENKMNNRPNRTNFASGNSVRLYWNYDSA